MERVQVFKADTTQAVKSLSELQKELREIKNRMAELDTGSDEFNNLAKKAGQITSRIGDINTAVKESAKQFNNLNKSIEVPALNVKKLFANATRIGAGIAGGFNIIGTSMKLLGNDTEDSNKALSELQAILQALPIQFISVAQGITSFGSAVDTLKDTFFFGAKSKNILSSYKIEFKDFEDMVGVRLIEKLTKLNEKLIDIQKITGKDTYAHKINVKLKNLISRYYATYDAAIQAGESIESARKMAEESIPELEGVNEAISNLNIRLNSFQKFRLDLMEFEREIGGLATTLMKFEFGAIIIGITAVIAAVVKLNKQVKELDKNSKDAYDKLSELFNINVTGLTSVEKEITLIRTLVKNAKDETNTLENRREAIRQLNEMVPDYNASLSSTGKLYEGNTKALSDYIAELKRQAIAVAAVDTITKKYKEIIEKSAQLQLAEQVKEQVEKAEKLREESYNKQIERAGIFNDQMITEERGVWEETSKVLTKTNRDIVASIPELKKDIEQALKDIDYIYDTYDTNLKGTVKKSGAGAEAGEEFKMEFINHSVPSIEQINALSEIITEDWIGNVPLTDAGKLLAKRVQNEIKVSGLGDTEDLTVKVNIAVGDFPENERLRQYLDFITESQRQLAVLNETMQRFGESSLGLTGSWQNVVSDFSSTFEQLANNIAKGENSFGSWTQMAASGIQSVGTLLNALSDEQDSTTKQGFEAQKKYQISATVMNTLAGIINAWSSALTITPPIGPVLGAANSAMIAALGAVQIAKIANQKFGEKSSVSSSSVNSTLIAPTQYTQAVQGANIETQLGDNRVWVSETDISNVGNRVRVQESENTY